MPTSGENATVYLVRNEETTGSDLYDEWIYVNNNWEHLGTAKIDLSQYYNKTEIDTMFANESARTESTYLKEHQSLEGYATETWVENKHYISGYTETDPVFGASAAHDITSNDIANWNAKQNILSAGTNINITNNVISTDGVATMPQLESHTQDTGIHVTALDKTTWDNKQDELVSGVNIKFINGKSILGSGNTIISDIETTYAELKSTRDNGELIPGLSYRITDYQCTTTQTGTTSAGHQFDIIVTADDTNTLNENARAVLHSGDTYFANSNLGAWELKYTIDNDSAKFRWADEINGKGVIYYMKDEFDNECPYDFKNIQFYRKWNTDTQLWSDNATSSDGVAAYTFSSDGFTASITEFTDFSIDSSNYISSNIIKRRTSADNHMIDDLLRLNNICFFGDTCYFNIFGENCYNNTLARLCRNNTFGADCYSNSLNDISGYNTFSNGCSFNVLASSCQYNTFGDDCDYNRLGVGCMNNVFGKKCCCNDLSSGNMPMVDGGCSNNVFGSGRGDLDSKSGIILHFGSCSNIFEANIKNVELAGEYIKNYRILSSASYEGTTEGIEFTQEYYKKAHHFSRGMNCNSYTNI